MITGSKDGIYKPKALHVTATATHTVAHDGHSTSAPHTVAKCPRPSSKQCSKSTKSGSSPKLDYTTIEPPTYKIAAQHPQWCFAIDDEFIALQRQGTWILVPPSPSQNLVGCKWVYKLKYNSDGFISRYKAVDFEETFSPVIKTPTIRIILFLAVQFNWPLRQLDVSNAFLHGFLREDVYMVQAPGYVDSAHPNHVCKLLKSLYGLKQAPRAWFERFSTQLLHMGFQASLLDSSLFTLRHGNLVAFLLVYVDDIVLTGNSPQFLTSLIAQLSAFFELKDLGPLSYFLGLQILRTSKGLFVTQTKYAQDLLLRVHMHTSKPARTPCAPNTRLSPTDGTLLSNLHEFRSLVGSLHYLTFTRPNLSFAVQQVCQFMSNPTDIHLIAAKRILRYVNRTLHRGVFFQPGPLSLSAFSD